MDEIYLTRLNKFGSELKNLSNNSKIINGLKSWNDEEYEQAKITSAKLQAVITRFNTELYQYFNAVTNPNADEISTLTTDQLDGEETLAELNARIQSKRDKTGSSITSSHHHPNRGKLPELNLPTFDGNVLQWTQFWDQFSSNIDQRDLREVDKLLYLKTSLKGNAKTILEGLETTNDNYKIAVTTLTDRYGKKSQIIDAHYSNLYKMARAENPDECRKTLDDIERHLRVLNSLGENTEHNHLRFLIMEKFPEDIIYELKLKVKDDTIQELRKELQLVLTAREDARRTCEEVNSKNKSYTTETLLANEYKRKPRTMKPETGKNAHKRFKPTLAAFNKTYNNKRKSTYEGNHSASTQKRRRVSCIFCSGDHFNDECTNVKTIQLRKAKLDNRCFLCLSLGHSARMCKRQPRTCPHCKKIGQHNRALCPTKEQSKKENTTSLHVNDDSSTVLQTAIVDVIGKDNTILKCRILFDCGSMRSYVLQSVAKKLKLVPEENQHLTVFTFAGEQPRELESPLAKLCLRTKTNKMKLMYVNIVPTMTHDISSFNKDFSEWKHRSKYSLSDDGSLGDQIDILIGNDYYQSLMLSEKVKIKENLYIVDSVFGWTLSGRSREERGDELSVLTYFQASYETKLNEPDLPLDDKSMRALWDLESIGIIDSPNTNRDEEAIKQFNESTTLKNGRYHVSWPWKDYPPELPTNYGLAYGRLVGLVKRLDKETLTMYDKTLSDQLERKIIEEVPNEKERNHPVHYLPFHGVKASGKALRLVYDASAKLKNAKSLNECLYTGPMMLEDLTGLLIQFRCHNIGLTADVEKAFLQIGLNNDDRDVTRFLWLKDSKMPVTEDNLVQYRFTRVPFGIISSPFLLNATIKHHLQTSEGNYTKQLASNIYVDNLLTGTESVDEALDLYKEAKGKFAEISMNLREWSSNSKEFLDQIQDVALETTVKTLGLNWELKEDSLHLRAKVNKTNEVTKRGILKTIAAIYDPCGFSVPIVLPAKLLLQQLWKQKVKWDSSLSDDTKQEWINILEDLKEIESIRLPRNITIPKENKSGLHCFTDSSTVAYAAVVYLVQGDNVQFIIGKSRLVPNKDQENLKIPKLEMLGVLIGSRLIKFVLKFLQLHVTQTILWTDSQIVKSWFYSDKLLEPFVSRRMEEIKKNKDLVVRYVPSRLNPADTATRPNISKEDREMWLRGPAFLRQDSKTWPKSPVGEVSLLLGEGLSDTEKHEKVKSQSANSNSVTITNQDTQLEEIRQLQKRMFPEEAQGKKTSLAGSLSLFCDTNGILRCDGRLAHSDLSYDAKYPILLPKESEFTERLIKETHEKNLHVGVAHTLSIIRQKYWIPQGRSRVQKTLSKCARCVKHGGGPFELPKTPALPVERVNFTHSFAYTGADYFGPMVVQTENGLKKRWICLFTCLVIRAIHLEVVKDLTTNECLMAFKRFIATRGIPTLILTDNASQFRLLGEVLTKEGNFTTNIKWKFIPQLAPWHGGAYERLVAIVKHCLKRTLQKQMLDETQLLTIIKEAEAVINTRPLTYVGSNLEHILKPADFLTPGKCLSVEVLIERLPLSGSLIKQQLIAGWNRGNKIMDEYKEMFVNQYLLSLRERYRNSPKQARVRSQESPNVGDIVQIKGEAKNREGWKVGNISELIKGKDGLCRIAKVKVGDKVFTRSLAHLYPLEVDEDTSFQDSTKESLVNEEGDVRIDTEGLSQYIPIRIEVNDVHVPTSSSSPKEDNYQLNINNENNLIPDQRELLEDTRLAQIIETTPEQASHGSETETNNEATPCQPVESSDQRRAAAVQAMEKIHRWTQELMTTIN